MPMASVLRVTWERREVRNRMTPTYPMVSSRSTISPAQGGPPVDLPGTPPQPWVSLQPWAMQKMYLYAGCAGVRLANASTMARAGMKASTAAQQKTRRDRPARLGLAGPKNRRASSGSPASSSTVAITWNWLTAAWPTRRLRPGRPGGGRRGRREQRRADEPARHQRLPREHPHPARPPGQPRQPRRHLVRLGPDRREPSPAARRAAATPRRAWPRPPPRSQLCAHGATPATAPRATGPRVLGFPRSSAAACPRCAALASAPVALASAGRGQPVQVPPRPAAAPARPASTPRPGPGRPAGSGSGTACPTSARSAWPARTRAATATADRTARPAPTASARRTRRAIVTQVTLHR